MTRHLTIVDRAATLAAVAHEGQVRKQDGSPYIAHPSATACALALAGHPPETVAAALLHDVIEDCDVNPSALERALGEGATAVMALVQGATEPDKNAFDWAHRKRTLAIRASTNRELGALTRRRQRAGAPDVTERESPPTSANTRPQGRKPLGPTTSLTCPRAG